MAFVVLNQFAQYSDNGVLAWRGDVIPLPDNDGRLLTYKVQVLQPPTWPPGMEEQVYNGLNTYSTSPVGLVQNCMQGYIAVAIAATVCRPIHNRVTLV